MNDTNIVQSYSSILPLPSEEDKINKFLNSSKHTGWHDDTGWQNDYQFLKSFELESFLKVLKLIEKYKNPAIFSFNNVFRVGEDKDVIDYYRVFRDMLLEVEVKEAEALPLECSDDETLPFYILFNELSNKINYHIAELKSELRVPFSKKLDECLRNNSEISSIRNDSEIFSILKEIADTYENNPKINSLVELQEKLIGIIDKFTDNLHHEDLSFRINNYLSSKLVLNCFKNGCYIIPFTYNNTPYYRHSRPYSYAPNGNNFVVTTVPYFESKIKDN